MEQYLEDNVHQLVHDTGRWLVGRDADQNHGVRTPENELGELILR